MKKPIENLKGGERIQNLVIKICELPNKSFFGGVAACYFIVR